MICFSLTSASLPPAALHPAVSLGRVGAVAGDGPCAVSEAASLSALLDTSSAVPAAPAASIAAAMASSDDAMTGILSVQRQQLRARVEQLEREAAALRQ